MLHPRALLIGLCLCFCTGCSAVELSSAAARVRSAVSGLEDTVDDPLFGEAALYQSGPVAAPSVDSWLVVWNDNRMNDDGTDEVWGAGVSFDGGLRDPVGLS